MNLSLCSKNRDDCSDTGMSFDSGLWFCDKHFGIKSKKGWWLDCILMFIMGLAVGIAG